MRGAAEVRRFEGELIACHGSDHVFLVSSGKAALYLILKALKRLHPGRDEVVIPAYTCYSVPSAILRAGLRVRLCDIDADTLDFDRALLAGILTERADRLLVVVPTHLFGLPADVPAIREITDGTAVTVVEDAAQALGGRSQGRPLGTLGDVGFFSLGRGKALTTVEGGVILTSNGDLAAALTEELALFGGYTAQEILGLSVQAVAMALLMDPRLFWLPKAFPFLRLGETHFDTGFALKRMSGFQAGLARGWQKRLARDASARRRHTGVWAEALKGTGDLGQPEPPGPVEALLRYPLLVADPDRRQAILSESERLGLGVMTAYPEPLDRLPVLKPHTHSPDCPGALQVARQLVTLPVHPYVTGRDRQRIRSLLFMS